MQGVSIMGKEGKSSAYGKAAKGIPTKGASMPYKGRSAEREKKIEEGKGRRGNACGQAMRSIAKRVEEEPGTCLTTEGIGIL